MNSITIYGRLTDKPEMSTTQTGTQVAKFSLADNRAQDKVSFFRCAAFGKVAERIASCEKGHRIVVAGRMEEDEWTDQQTQQKRRAWQVIVEAMSYVEAAPAQPSTAAPQPAPYQPPAGYQPPGYYPQLPGVAPGYGYASGPAPAPGYVPPQPGQPGYPAPSQGYGAPPAGYQPQPGYTPPAGPTGQPSAGQRPF